MKSRTDIQVQKIWVDNNNMYNTRPDSTEITLFRDEEIYKTVTVDSTGDGSYTLTCLPVCKNSGRNYVYRVDELEVPDNYTKRIEGYNVINTLNSMEISGVKTWNDNNNQDGFRPASIMVNLLRNGEVIDTMEVNSPPDQESTIEFTFGERPFADAQGVPYVYTVSEDEIENYQQIVTGFNITNTVQNPFTAFSFVKTSAQTKMSLQGAEFEIKKNGVLIQKAVSDKNGIVAFSIPVKGTLQMTESQPPAGYMSDIIVYEVLINNNGIVTINGQPVSKFTIQNQLKTYDININRATNVLPDYMKAPNTWPLHGTALPNLYMTDKVLVTMAETPAAVKWDSGVKNTAYFKTGGHDIKNSYSDGFTVVNGVYTVYASFSNGYEIVKTITVDRIRDGSANMPYLLINYATAAALEPSVTGIEKFTLDYMQGGGIKLAQSYELYENIDMTGIKWMPLGTTESDHPYKPIEGFSGNLEGNGHAINNLTLTDAQTVNTFSGLFLVVVDGAVIQNFDINYNITCQGHAGITALIRIQNGGAVLFKNLKIINSTITNNSFAGGIAANVHVNNGSLNIDGCSGTNLNITNSSAGGGALGVVHQEPTTTISISNCNFSGNVISNVRNASGIMAQIGNKGICTVTNCISNMNLTTMSDAGGIIGLVTQPATSGLLKISSCCNRGNISASITSAGILGIIIKENDFPDTSVENCYNTGTINLKSNTTPSITASGGLIGQVVGIVSLLNSYNIGDVIGKNGGDDISVGGISGKYCITRNCASIASETSSMRSKLARISPTNSGTGSLNNNLAFDTMKVLINGVPKTPLYIGSSGLDGMNASAAEIKTQALYQTNLGWNFDDIWSFGNKSYTLPVLRGIPLESQPDILPSHLI